MRTLSCTVMVISLVAALAGCAGTTRIKAEDRAAIPAVSIAEAVKVDGAQVIGSEAGALMLFGAVGGAIAADTGQSGGQDFKKLLETSGVDVGDIVRERFAAALKEHPFYGSRLAADGGYRFVLQVRSYGINKTHTFSSHWMPNLHIYYQLLSPEGKMVAEDWATTILPTGLPTFTAEEMNANPQILRDAFEKAAAGISAKLVKRMG